MVPEQLFSKEKLVILAIRRKVGAQMYGAPGALHEQAEETGGSFMELLVPKEQHPGKEQLEQAVMLLILTLVNIYTSTVSQALLNAKYALFSFNSHKLFTKQLYCTTEL